MARHDEQPVELHANAVVSALLVRQVQEGRRNANDNESGRIGQITMRRVLVIALLVACAPSSGTSQQDLGVPSKDGAVVCTSAPACDAGASVLAKGGNAVDAAVATAFALAVTHPSAGNIGGGG